ncbi:MAG TPA: DUF2071 domain-containing protein [Bryobacteraceae bacterium]|nr:DUF2071 domain-containing protein [Bryobacteraceae bacterium]
MATILKNEMNPRRVFLTAEWRDLAVLNFEIDPSMLRSFLPARTELDLWKGKALVSLVGFRFLNTRVLGLRVPFHADFDEVNLRFSVQGPQGRGVVFIKELVPKRAVAFIARTVYGERYAAGPMSHRKESISGRTSVSYAWHWRGVENFFEVTAQGDPEPMREGSAEAFIFEHYWGYGRKTYRVEHPSWRVWRATAGKKRINGDALYGAGFGAILAGPPVSCMLAEGSEVSVFRGE